MDRSPEMPGAQAKRGQNAPAGHYTYDGPGDSDSRGRSASNAPSRARSQSRTASQTRAAQMETARAMQKPEARVQQLLRNVEFGGNAYNLFSSVSFGFSSPYKATCELASHATIFCNSVTASSMCCPPYVTVIGSSHAETLLLMPGYHCVIALGHPIEGSLPTLGSLAQSGAA
ncbi:hypothetical protein JMJ35_000231 [Cladonia borealis]|uniref:Uncharacterized protein n=1 Tax=Cladonia borealis TaxID=184061 RepID=A0AA39UEZ6_9LECA|nr:hypothetical protein JMJ35_000231 [Cladonia borealis]